MKVHAIDHIVLTVADVEATVDFYRRVLGMSRITFGGGRTALGFGDQKINLHQLGNEVRPNARAAAAGTGDLCFLTEAPAAETVAQLEACGVAIEYGPAPQQGARGDMESVYFRDPDGNLIEVAKYD